MDVLKLVLTSLSSVIALFLLTRLIGRRQMSQLSLFDYVVGITIGSIAAEMATDLEGDVWPSFLAMVVYTAVTIGISYLNNKSKKLRCFFLGKPLILYDSGTLYYQNLKKAKMDLSEFLIACRNSGYFDLSELSMAVIEANGRVSFLPLEQKRPVRPDDMQLKPAQKRAPVPVIMDGVVMEQSLKSTGNNLDWLAKQMKMQGFTQAEDILLALADADNQLMIYEKNEDKGERPLFD